MMEFDSASGQQVIHGPHEDTWVHTPVNTPLAVIVNLNWSNDTAEATPDDTISAITYGGVSMTYFGEVLVGDCHCEKWGLLNPPSGAQTVSITWTGTTGTLGAANSNTYYANDAVSCTFGALDTTTDSTSPIDNAVTGTSTRNIFDHGYLIYDGSSAAVTPTIVGTNETLRSSFLTQFDAGHYTRRQSGTSSQTSAAGALTASMTLSADRACAVSSVEIIAGPTIHVAAPTRIGSPTRIIGPIKYGYPTAQKVEPNVKLQYLFDEASSTNIVDEVGGQVLTVTGSPTSVSAPGHFNPISPGLQYNGLDRHYSAAMTGLSCVPGQHIVEEFWLHPVDTTSSVQFPSLSGGATFAMFQVVVNLAPTWLLGAVLYNDGLDDIIAPDFVLPPSMWTAKPHHFRVKCVRGSNVEFYMDGVSLAANTPAVFPTTTTYTLDQLQVAEQNGHTYYEFRLSIGSDVANNHSYPAYNFHVATPTRIVT